MESVACLRRRLFVQIFLKFFTGNSRLFIILWTMLVMLFLLCIIIPVTIIETHTDTCVAVEHTTQKTKGCIFPFAYNEKEFIACTDYEQFHYEDKY